MSEEALQIAEKRREVKSKGERETCTHLNAKLKRIARRDKKAFLKISSRLENCRYLWGQVEFQLSSFKS